MESGTASSELIADTVHKKVGDIWVTQEMLECFRKKLHGHSKYVLLADNPKQEKRDLRKFLVQICRARISTIEKLHPKAQLIMAGYSDVILLRLRKDLHCLVSTVSSEIVRVLTPEDEKEDSVKEEVSCTIKEKSPPAQMKGRGEGPSAQVEDRNESPFIVQLEGFGDIVIRPHALERFTARRFEASGNPMPQKTPSAQKECKRLTRTLQEATLLELSPRTWARKFRRFGMYIGTFLQHSGRNLLFVIDSEESELITVMVLNESNHIN